jgi:uncharacterized protein (TIGR02147 family)
MKEIYSYDDYKEFIKDSLVEKGHGSRLKLAASLNCQSAYISSVLNQMAHFSLEQASEAAAFFYLDSDEEEFLLHLVQYARSGTKRLRELYLKKIKSEREKRSLLSNRIQGTHTLDEVTQTQYYSRWYYAAIHVLVTVPQFKKKENISKYLNLPQTVVNEALDFLMKTGLVVLKEDGLSSGKTRVFLKGDSPLIVQHHENWRLKAIESVTLGSKENVHFSSVYSLSQKDFVIIKEKLLSHLQEVREIVKPSPEEEVCVLNLDFFSLRWS